jgi:hypothetical protein
MLIVYVLPALKPRRKIPKELDDRAMLVARSFVRGDRDRIADVSESSTTRYLDEWLDKVRPKGWDKSRPIMETEIAVVSRSPKTKKATVIVTLSEPAPPPPLEIEPLSPVEPTEDGTMPAAPGGPEAAVPEGTAPAQPPPAGSETAAPGQPPSPPPSEGSPAAAPDFAEGTAVIEAGGEAVAVAQAPEPAKKFRLTLYWDLVEGEGWLLDLAQTLKHAN